MNKTSQNGFTLLELLVVVMIVGTLTSILVINVRHARAKARDTQRISDVKILQTKLALYKDKNGRYPLTDTITQGNGTISTPEEQSIPDLWPYTVPVAPTPVDGNCLTSHVVGTNPPKNTNIYHYRSVDGSSYSITFCTGTAIGQYPAGYLVALSSGEVYLRYDMNRDGVIKRTVAPSDPGYLAGCASGSSCSPQEFFDVTLKGASNTQFTSFDAATLSQVLLALGYP